MRDGCSGMGMAASRLQGERRCDSKGAGVTVVMVPEKTREKPHTSKLDPRAGRRAPNAERSPSISENPAAAHARGRAACAVWSVPGVCGVAWRVGGAGVWRARIIRANAVLGGELQPQKEKEKGGSLETHSKIHRELAICRGIRPRSRPQVWYVRISSRRPRAV